MTTWVNESKNSSTFLNHFRHGRDLSSMNDLANFKFTDVVFDDGTQLKDVTFAELVDTVWTKLDKSADPTWSYPARN